MAAVPQKFFLINMKRIFFLSLLLLVASFSKAGKLEFNANCVEAYNELLSLKFASAQKLIAEEKARNPQNKIVYLLDNYVDFLNCFAAEDKNSFQKLKDNLAKRISQVENADSSSPLYYYSLGEMNLQSCFIKFKFKEYTTGVFELRKAYNYFLRGQKRHPEFKANLKSLGAIRTILGTIPSEFSWATKLLGMNGSILQGVNDLKIANNSLKNDPKYGFLYIESSILLSFFQMYIMEEPQEALAVMNAYEKENDNKIKSPILTFVEADIYKHMGRTEDAIETILKRPLGAAYYDLPYFNYMLGLLKLYKISPEAPAYFLKYINTYKGNSFVQAAWQKMAWYYLIQGNEAKYKEYIAHCKKTNNEVTDEDKQAIHEAESKEMPNVYLLKARMLCDGGYYKRALEEVQAKPMTSFPRVRDQLEYTYRLGRIYQKLGDFEKALTLYSITVKNGQHVKYYYPSIAAYELGNIYSDMRDKTKARYYYQMCIDLKSSDYDNGLDQKAKAAMGKL